jgi:hypothetical protein
MDGLVPNQAFVTDGDPQRIKGNQRQIGSSERA